jgi:hypothetical protein
MLPAKAPLLEAKDLESVERIHVLGARDAKHGALGQHASFMSFSTWMCTAKG